MAWVMLGIAGLFEVAWATFMKLSEGFSKAGWTVLTFAGMAVSFLLLARATKTLPLGTAYAVWTGIGALGSVCGHRRSEIHRRLIRMTGRVAEPKIPRTVILTVRGI